MSTLAVIAQAQPSDTSSAAAAIFGVVVLVGVLSILALLPRGRRALLPLVAVLLGLLIVISTISDARNTSVSALTALGLFFGALLLIGGLGAAREGIALPQVDGVEPEIGPSASRVTPED